MLWDNGSGSCLLVRPDPSGGRRSRGRSLVAGLHSRDLFPTEVSGDAVVIKKYEGSFAKKEVLGDLECFRLIVDHPVAFVDVVAGLVMMGVIVAKSKVSFCLCLVSSDLQQ